MVQTHCLSRPLLLIVGPTASGKSALAMRIAEKLETDIISCDSMQIYRGMDIGTAKPTPAEQARVVHHMIDVAPIDREYSVYDYVSQATEILLRLDERGKTGLIAGGTGLYATGLLFGYELGGAGKSREIRDDLAAQLRELGSEAMYEKLRQVDPESAESIHPNNVKRVLRALEIYALTGRPKSRAPRQTQARYPYLAIGLARNRDRLYAAIDARVDEMLERGLVEEVRRFYDAGYPASLQALQGIGYKELYAFFSGSCGFDEAVEAIRSHTKHYAKRQITWFQRLSGIRWLDADETDDPARDVLEMYRSLL